MQYKRRLEAETRAENADKQLAELSPKLENVRDMVSIGFDVHIQKLTVLYFLVFSLMGSGSYLSKIKLR